LLEVSFILSFKALLQKTKYTLEITSGQRSYGGPPPKDIYDGDDPGAKCQVFIGKIPNTAYEDELVPLFEQFGIIWNFRLMMDPATGNNRGFAFCSFTTPEDAANCVKELNNHELRPMRHIGVCLSHSNCRLFIGSIPKTRTKEEIFEDFNTATQGLKDVIVYLQTEDKNKNRGFCFLEFKDHKAASMAKRRLTSSKDKFYNNGISVDWADPIEEPSEEIMSKVKVLYVNNLATKVSEEMIKEIFSKCGQVDRVKKIKDYAFVHFQERSEAMKALEELNGKNIEGEDISVTLAKPMDRAKKNRKMDQRKIVYDFKNMNINSHYAYKQNRFHSGRLRNDGHMAYYHAPPPNYPGGDGFLPFPIFDNGYVEQPYYGVAPPFFNHMGQNKRGAFSNGRGRPRNRSNLPKTNTTMTGYNRGGKRNVNTKRKLILI